MVRLNAIVLDSRIRGLPATSAVRQIRQNDPNVGCSSSAGRCARTRRRGSRSRRGRRGERGDLPGRDRGAAQGDRAAPGRAATPRIEVAGLVLDIDTQTVEVQGR
jgi:hypothetical protein